jgi:hypothetical protein
MKFAERSFSDNESGRNGLYILSNKTITQR